LGCFFIPLTWANTQPDINADKNLQQIREQIEQIRNKISRNQKKESKLETGLRTLALSLARSTQVLRDIERRVYQQQRQLDELQQTRGRQSQRLDELNADLAKVIKAAYGLGRQGRLRLLLSSEDPAVLARNQIYFNYVADSQAALIKEIEQGMEALYSTESHIVAGKESLQELKRNKLAKRNDLQQQRARRQQLLQVLRKDLGQQENILERLLANERQLQALVDELQSLSLEEMELREQGSFRDMKGQLSRPLRGELLQHFGRQRQGSGLAAKGVVIQADAGSAVHAIFNGRVVFADWLRGFGMLIIIDHGSEFMSLYGQNQSLYKEVGEWVMSGEEIAGVGDGGVSAQQGLYFELREKGRPVNPQGWWVTD